MKFIPVSIAHLQLYWPAASIDEFLGTVGSREVEVGPDTYNSPATIYGISGDYTMFDDAHFSAK
ncbi:LOW QUALITY PROTEIN: hypothetical protein DASB73_020930 [Starmerella bacillaris]|uniref:Uncharacterized protein n=1 Tax=Starmerella bacillaris TaxID=1247836 RepID=A0AAV5RID4_STABA|nr:LOW QUALITY PROTEIN: hypothetical protein DASB73_020930 [Starmerella bacillaris]